jgi:two-component system chemotaxis response regulator CheY
MLDVLIVDDSSAIRKILQRVLVQAGLPIGNIFEAGDGVEALQKLRDHTVGLVLSEINMPNMNGLELVRQIKAVDCWKNLPIVMVSTEGSQARVLETVQLGAAGYIRKPFLADQVREKLAVFFQ